jgi:hypothetical protein
MSAVDEVLSNADLLRNVLERLQRRPTTTDQLTRLVAASRTCWSWRAVIHQICDCTVH